MALFCDSRNEAWGIRQCAKSACKPLILGQHKESAALMPGLCSLSPCNWKGLYVMLHWVMQTVFTSAQWVPGINHNSLLLLLKRFCTTAYNSHFLRVGCAVNQIESTPHVMGQPKFSSHWPAMQTEKYGEKTSEVLAWSGKFFLFFFFFAI